MDKNGGATVSVAINNTSAVIENTQTGVNTRKN